MDGAHSDEDVDAPSLCSDYISHHTNRKRDDIDELEETIRPESFPVSKQMSDKVYPNLPSFDLADCGPQERHAALNHNEYGEDQTDFPTRGSQVGLDLLYRGFQRQMFSNAVTTVER